MKKRQVSDYSPYEKFKRVLDIILAAIALTILSPFIIVLAFINLFFSRFHPFYLDDRVGRNGKKIKIIKFTTMKIDAEANANEYLTEEQMKEWESERKVEDDPRTTVFGRFLRKTSFDEVPQLLNVISGTIAFVGPRPVTKKEIEMHYTYKEREKLLSVKPGLTGNWAVHGRNKVEYKDHKRQDLELEYVDKISLKMDIKIILLTFLAVFKIWEVK